MRATGEGTRLEEGALLASEATLEPDRRGDPGREQEDGDQLNIDSRCLVLYLAAPT